MPDVLRILVPTDFSACARAALLHGAHLARHYDAELHVLHVASGSGYAREAAAREMESLAAEGRQAATLQGLRVRSRILPSDDAARTALAYVREHAISLVVAGAYGDASAKRFLLHGLEHMLAGSTAERLVSGCPAPVLTVGMRSGRLPSLVRRILAAVDAFAPDDQALAYARDAADLYGAHLDVVGIGGRRFEGAEAAEATLERLAEACRGAPGPATSFHSLGQAGGAELGAFARGRDVQLVVKGPGVPSPQGAFSVLSCRGEGARRRSGAVHRNVA